MSVKAYFEFEKLLKSIRIKAKDALELSSEGDKAGVQRTVAYMREDYERLNHLSTSYFEDTPKTNLGRHLSFAMDQDFNDIIRLDVPAYKEWVVGKFSSTEVSGKTDFDSLLDPTVKKASLKQYLSKNYREAVLNAVISVFDLIRQRTKLTSDGAKLVDEVFKLDDPQLIFSELETESGQNDQKGFMNLLKGAYIGIRNVKSHSLSHDLDEEKAAQYLILSSLLARRVREAKAPDFF